MSNVIIKIVTKVVANRLKPVMNDLVGVEQANFIPGRHTIDNIVVAQEALHSLRKKQGKKGTMLVKIDLEKAYDRIWWPFLEVVLERIRIGRHSGQGDYELYILHKTFDHLE